MHCQHIFGTDETTRCPGLTRIGLSFPSSGGGALAGLFRYHADVTSWQVTFFLARERGALVVLYIVLQTAVFGSYFALFIAITITVIVIAVV